METTKNNQRVFITNKWSDPTYRACFSGVDNLRAALNNDFGLSLSKKEVLDALKTIPSFVNRITTKKVKKWRSYDVPGAFDTWTMDLGFLPKIKHFIGFLLCVDIGSRKVYTRIITNKLAKTIKQKLNKIFEEDCSNFTPQTIITDAGKEFVGLKGFFSEHSIYHKVMKTSAKASIAERYIGMVKQRLYKAMDTLQTKDWTHLLADIVAAINSTEKEAIGGIKPSEINTPFDNVKLDKVAKNKPYHQPHWYEQVISQEKYEENKKNIQVGDLVLSHTFDKKEKFKKGYQLHVSVISFSLVCV